MLCLFSKFEKGGILMEESLLKRSKTICIKFPSKNFYHNCMGDYNKFRNCLTDAYARFPELFPADFSCGFNFHDIVTSEKQNNFSMRRIMLKNQSRDVYQIRPSFMMPYMISENTDVGKALFLRRRGVPFDAPAYVFGRDAMFRQRACVSIGRNSIVGTTVKSPDLLPGDLAADEKLSRSSGKKAVIAAAAARECIPGWGPAEHRVNKFCYRENRLQNLLVAGSTGGRR